MIPIKLLFTRNAGLLIYINLVTGMALYAVFYFSDIYFALVLNFSPGKAGTNLIYYMPGLSGKTTPLHSFHSHFLFHFYNLFPGS
jgi:hypothetical protein